MSLTGYRYAAAPPAPPPRRALIHERADRARSSSAAARTDTITAPDVSPVHPYPATLVPTAFQRQMLNRCTWGLDAGTWADMRRPGGAVAWFERQLDPQSLPDPHGDTVDSWYDDLMTPAAGKWATVYDQTKFQWDYAVDLANWSLL